MNRFEASAGSEWRPDDLMRYYHDSLSSIAADHNAALLQASLTYKQDIINWRQTGLADVSRFGVVLEKPGMEVTGIADSSHSLLSDVVGQASELFVAGLSPADKGVWQEVQSKASRHGISSIITARALGNSSGNEAFLTMKAALDKDVWRDVQSKASRYGIGSLVVTQALGNSSGPEALAAMKAALDKDVWLDVQNKADRYGVGGLVVTQALGNGSGPEVIIAMKAALDKSVWRDVQNKVSRYGIDSQIVIQVLGNSSSAEARDAMYRLLPRGTRTHNPRREAFDPFDARLRDIFSDSFKTGFQNAGARRRSADQHSRQATPPHREPPKAEAPKENPILEEAKLIVGRITVDRRFSWLASEDTSAVARVITTVRTIRQRAADEGKAITDKEIYIRYRWQIEKTDPSPRLSQSFRILDAMMGGKPGGKLPF